MRLGHRLDQHVLADEGRDGERRGLGGIGGGYSRDRRDRIEVGALRRRVLDAQRPLVEAGLCRSQRIGVRLLQVLRERPDKILRALAVAGDVGVGEALPLGLTAATASKGVAAIVKYRSSGMDQRIAQPWSAEQLDARAA
jgi:hypothetical protein